MQAIDSDFSRIEETNCYCSPESAALIRAAIAELPLHAVHLLGTGDYHYLSLFWAERVEVPFSLVLFDNHPDDQPGAFGDGLLSCGSWVADARQLPECKEVVWNGIGASSKDVWLSIDLDVLSSEYAHTDWSQGDMTLPDLLSALRQLGSAHNILGVDICGGISPSKGGTREDLELNDSTVQSILELF